jgi:hypothetical protein
MYRFVRPETVRLDLGDGDWVRVKQRLNHGEQRQAYEQMCTVTADGTLKVNPFRVPTVTVRWYLVDWNLTEEDGRPIEIRGRSHADLDTTLDNLDPEAFAELWQALEAHIAAMTQARAQEKKTRPGATPSPATLPSPFAAAGASSGSAPSTRTTIAS